MDRNTKIALVIMAAVIIFHDRKLGALVEANNTNSRIIKETTEVMEQAATDLQFYSMTNDIGE